MPSSSIFSLLERSRSERATSTSSTTIERLLTLLPSGQHRLTTPLENLLIGNSLELTRSTNKFLSNLAGKLANGDKVAYTETKAHRNLEYGTITRR